MPIYEYYCNQCRDRFSAIRSMSQADEAIACPTCNSLEAQRALSLFAFRMSTGSSLAPAGNGCGCGGGGCGCRTH